MSSCSGYSGRKTIQTWWCIEKFAGSMSVMQVWRLLGKKSTIREHFWMPCCRMYVHHSVRRGLWISNCGGLRITSVDDDFMILLSERRRWVDFVARHSCVRFLCRSRRGCYTPRRCRPPSLYCIRSLGWSPLVREQCKWQGWSQGNTGMEQFMAVVVCFHPWGICLYYSISLDAGVAGVGDCKICWMYECMPTLGKEERQMFFHQYILKKRKKEKWNKRIGLD